MEAQADLDSFVHGAIRRACNNIVEAVDPATPMAALNLDSLTLVSLIAQVESVFEVQLTSEQIVALIESYSVGDLVGRLQEFVGGRGRVVS
jgi:acyl carrier protein